MKNLPQIKTNIVLTEDIQNDIKSIFSSYIGMPLTKQLKLKIQNEIDNMLNDKFYNKNDIYFSLKFNQ